MEAWSTGPDICQKLWMAGRALDAVSIILLMPAAHGWVRCRLWSLAGLGLRPNLSPQYPLR